MALWIVGCIALAIWTASSVRRLEPVGDTLMVSSRALGEASDALDSIRDVPFIGADIGNVGDRIDEVARSARESAVETRTAIDQVSMTLAIAIVVVAIVPPLVAYVVVRRRWTRERAPTDGATAR